MAVVARDDRIQIEKLPLGYFDTNAYIIIDLATRDSVLVDAPAEAGVILEKLGGTNPRYILLTHGHSDHTGALREVKSRLGIPLATHAADVERLPETPDRRLSDGEHLTCGSTVIEVLHTPGHTTGSLCFLAGCYLISGDTLFPGGPGRTASPEAFEQVINSITERIFTLPDDTLIFPGHGEATILKKEKEAFAVFSSRSHPPGLCGDVLWLTS